MRLLRQGARRHVVFSGVGIYASASEPSSPSTGDRWAELNGSGRLLYPEVGDWEWSGSQWIGTNVNLFSCPFNGVGSGTVHQPMPPYSEVGGVFDLIIDTVQHSYYVQGVHSGANYYSVEFFRRNSSNTLVSLLSTTTRRGSETFNAWYNYRESVNTVIDVSATDCRVLAGRIVATGSPGSYFGGMVISSRYVRP